MFVGKGGTGRTTMAAAAAVSLAAQGRRVLLASLDQAHSLSDVLDRRVGRDAPTPVADGLDAVEIDTLALLETRYRSLVALLALAGTHDHGTHLADLAPEELTGLPGVEDVLGLGEIVRLAGTGRWDVVVVDCPPTADAWRALALPDTVAGYVERVWPQHRRIAAATSSDTRVALGVAMLDRVLDATAAVSSLLADRARTALRVVTTPERVVLAETRRVLSVAALAGLRVDAVVVNKLLPQPDSTDDSAASRWYAAQRAAQQDALDDFAAAVGEVPVLTADHDPVEPIGWDALGHLAGRLGGDGPALDDGPGRHDGAAVRVQLEAGSGDVDSVYAMRMYLPLTDTGTLTLGRVEDDLLVGADGRRRRVRLASVLRRCVVRDADFDGTDLVVRFVPDPAVWPR